MLKPDHVLNALDWATEIQKKKQEIYDNRNENSLYFYSNDSEIVSSLSDKIKSSGLVKVVNKLFLQKKFKTGIISNQ